MAVSRSSTGRERESIIYDGFVSDLQKEQFFADIDCMVMPSEWPEPSSTVINEAKARGLPVLGAWAGGIPEYVPVASQPLLYPSGDVDALVESMRAVAEDPKRYAPVRGSRSRLGRPPRPHRPCLRAGQTMSEAQVRDLPEMLSVVVPVLDCETMIETQLDALAAQDYKGDWEVLVVDNGSTDGTVEVAKAYADRVPNLRIIDASSRRGVSTPELRRPRRRRRPHPHLRRRRPGAAVLGAQDGGGEPGPRHHRRLPRHEAAQRHRDPLVAQPVQPRSPSRAACSTTSRSRSAPTWASPGPASRPSTDGGEESICGGDDVDFSWRAQQAGFRLGMAPGAVIDYRYGPASGPCTGSSSGTGWLIRSSTSTTGRGRAPERSSGRGAVVVRLLLRSPLLLTTRRRRGLWIRNFAFRWGRLRGSIRYRSSTSRDTGRKFGPFSPAWLAVQRGASNTLRAGTPLRPH